VADTVLWCFILSPPSVIILAKAVSFDGSALPSVWCNVAMGNRCKNASCASCPNSPALSRPAVQSAPGLFFVYDSLACDPLLPKQVFAGLATNS
jgi:hypothetical protein